MNDHIKVCIVSGNLARAQACKESLETSSEFKCTISESVDSSIDRIESDKPNVLLIDYAGNYNLAEKVCEAIKQKDEFESLPVLLVSDVEDQESMSDLYVLGADDFLQEPYTSAELCARLKRLAGVSSCSSTTSSDASSAALDRIRDQLDQFELIRKIDMVKQELQNNANNMIDIHEDIRAGLAQAADAVARAEYSLQFTDKVAQQVNEIGKLVYGIHMGVKRGEAYTEQEGLSLVQSSSSVVLEEDGDIDTDALLKSLNI